MKKEIIYHVYITAEDIDDDDFEDTCYDCESAINETFADRGWIASNTWRVSQ